MRTILQFVFRFLTIRLRITTTIALSLLLGFTLWSLAWSIKVKAAPTAPIAATSGYLYVLNDCRGCANQIFGFAVDETTGVLSPLTSVGFPLSTGGTGKGNNLSSELLTIDRKNLRLFAINDGSNTVSAYAIDPATGALTVLFTPIDLPLPAVQPAAPHWSTIAVRPSGSDSLVVVGDIGQTVGGGRLASFKITATTATAAVGSPFATDLANPLSTAFSQDGEFVYTGGGTSGKIAGFKKIGAEGVLAPLNGSAFDSGNENPAGYATDAEGRLFVVSRPFSRPRVYTTPNGGIPQFVSELTVTGANDGGPAVLDPNHSLYMVSEITGSHVSVYQVSGHGNATKFTKVNGSPFPSGGNSVTLLALNQAGTFLFAAHGIEHTLTTLTVDGAGTLAIKLTQPVNTLCPPGPALCSLTRPSGIAYLPPRTTTMTIDAPAITCGQDGTVTVNVNSPAGNPTGNVTLTVDGGAPMTQPLIGDPSATFTIPAPALGNHALVATFSAQNGFTAISATGTLVVNLASTTTTIDAPAITCGQNGTVIVNVSSPVGNPTGEVKLQVDGVERSQTLSGGSATFIIDAPTANNHPLVATYSAQGCFASSPPASGTLGVNLASTTTTIDAPGIIFGQKGSVIVKVSSPDGNPTGEVRLQVDGVERSQTLSGGSATFIIDAPTANNHPLVATYSGQGCFASSIPASGTLVVGVARTSTKIDAPGIVFGQDGTIIVKVVSLFAKPSGTVLLRVDGGAPMTRGLFHDGSATFTINQPALGVHTLRATFPAQGGFASSSSPLGKLTVRKGKPSTTTIDFPPVFLEPAPVGQTAPVNVRVSSIFSEPPSGTVSLQLDHRPVMTQTLTNGLATFNILVPPVGLHLLKATFPAQAGFATSHTPVVFFIVRKKVPTTLR